MRTGDVIGVLALSTLFYCAMYFGGYLMRSKMESKIKSNKTFIIEHSSYRCKRVKTLEDE